MKSLFLPLLVVPAAFVAATVCPLALGAGALDHNAASLNIAEERKIDSLLALMTLDEKVGQLVQYSARFLATGPGSDLRTDLNDLARQGKVGSFLNVRGAEATRKVQKIVMEETRLKIPMIFGLDVIHGYRTTFPIPLAEASTWEPDLIQRAARVAGREAAAAGIHWTFAPMVDIARDPRWGRIAEGSGEDPYLGSLMAAARVHGFQGEDVSADTTVVACPKHFAAYGGAEGGRDYNTVDISERTLREVYLPPFEAAIRAGAGSLMCSFNEIAGIPSSANRMLLTDILRREWGFTGFVVSDWGSINEMIMHGNAASAADAAGLSITAGVDMDMEGNAYHNTLAGLVQEGKVPMATVDEAVRRVLRAKFRLGLFDDPYRYCSSEREKATLLHPDHLRLAREVARKSIVLLKNEKEVLPLRKDLRTLAVVGPLAASKGDPLGCWSAAGDSMDVVSVLEGIRGAVSPQTTLLYAQGCGVTDGDEVAIAAAVHTARKADAVIAVVGEDREMSGEARNRSSITLPGMQEELVRALAATGKPLVVVLMNGRPLAIPWVAEDIPGVVEGWFLGVQTGTAIADVVFGDYNPGGKLPASFPRATGQIPIYYNHKNTGRPPDETERYTSQYIDLPSTPQFPFGYGLSYTRFAYSDLALSDSVISPDGTLGVSVRVTNTGSRDGEEVVQLYVRDDVGSVTRPVKELKGFKRITLKGGEQQKVEFTITPGALTMYNTAMKRVVEPGTFTVYVGGNSRDVMEGRFRVGGR